MASIKKVGVVGCGTMGSGIAIVSSRAGYETFIVDSNEKNLSALMTQSADFFKKSIARGKMSADQLEPTLSRLHTSSNLQSLQDCDIVIEAIFEDLQVKHQLFAK